MRLDFTETYLVNQFLTKANKRAFINNLKRLLKQADLDDELRNSINKLVDKFETLSENQVRIIYEDKVAGKITTLPQYVIE